MFCPFLDFMLKKTIKPMFLLSALLFVLGVQVCFGQPTPQLAPQVINNDLVVTKTLRVGMSPNALTIGPRAKLQVGGLIGSGGLRIGPWPANPDNYVFFGVSTLNQSDSINYALLQDFAGKDKGRTFLNSPVDIRFRIKNKDKMVLSTTNDVGRLAVVGDRITLNDPTSDNEIVISTSSGTSLRSSEELLIGSTAGPVKVEGRTGVVVGRRGAPGQPGTDAISVPQGALHVVGEIALTEVNVWDGKDENDLTWNGTKITREGSSLRYKANIGPLEADFHKTLDLEPKQYQMKEGFGEPDQWLFGYIAEDLHELGLGKLCTYDKDHRPDGIKYKKLAMYVLEVVKEQQERINQLEESFNEMEMLLAEKRNTKQQGQQNQEQTLTQFILHPASHQKRY